MAEKNMTIPAHVPRNLFVDFDTYNPPDEIGDYHRAIKKAHDFPDIFWTPYRGGHWVATRGEDLPVFLKDYDTFGSRPKTIPKEEANPQPLFPIEADPPLQTAYRQLINPWFTPKAVGDLEKRARDLSIELIEDFYKKGECEFVTEFAAHLPIAIFMKLVDLPYTDREYLMQLAETPIYAKNHEEVLAAFQKMFEYIAIKLKERIANPGTDLLSKIAVAEIDGKPLSFEEKTGCAALVLIGGLDTVASTLGFVAHFLANSPAHRKQILDNPGIAQDATEELLRRFGVATTNRILNRDFVYKGIEFKKGDQIHLMVNMHGLDERCFADPMKVDFTRKVSLHSTFGNGPHRCPGSFLARTEVRVFLEEWIKRIPDFQVKPGVKPGIRSGVNGSFHYLPLVWDVK